MVATKWRGKNSLRARTIFKAQRLRDDSASKTPAIRFKEKARFKDEIAAAEPTSVYAVDEHATVQQNFVPGNAVQRTNL
jgi:hypothetical protein